MNLDALIIEPRVRAPWAAIDIGFTLARRYWLKGVICWLLLALPIYFSLKFLLASNDWLPALFLWWLKPLFERPLLYLLSRELFSEQMTLRRVWLEWRLWLKPKIVAILVTNRLSVARSFYAAVHLLEQSKGADYGLRTGILGRRSLSEATWLTVVLFHFETFFTFAVWIGLLFLMPFDVEFDQGWLGENQLLSNGLEIIGLLVMASIAPFYVSAGFMLYISRRIELEGWDIEICFRNWVSKKDEPNHVVASLAK